MLMGGDRRAAPPVVGGRRICRGAAASDRRWNRSLRDDALVRRVLGDSAALCIWLALTLAAVIVAVAVSNAVWAVAGWAVGGVAAVIVVAVKMRRGR